MFVRAWFVCLLGGGERAGDGNGLSRVYLGAVMNTSEPGPLIADSGTSAMESLRA